MFEKIIANLGLRFSNRNPVDPAHFSDPLVLQDGRRLNVVDHGNREQLRADAATLARFLGKPLWDAL